MVLTSPCPILLLPNAKLGSDKYQFYVIALILSGTKRLISWFVLYQSCMVQIILCIVVAACGTHPILTAWDVVQEGNGRVGASSGGNGEEYSR